MERQGFVIARGAVPTYLCNTLRAEALDAAASPPPLLTRALALFGLTNSLPPIRSPSNRAHIPLGAGGDAAEQALEHAVAALAQPLREVGLLPDAALVELSCMISFPGALSQHPHTDVYVRAR